MWYIIIYKPDGRVFMKSFKERFKKIFEFVMLLTGDQVSVYAAQASFFLIISAIPFLMLVFTLMKLFIDVDLTYITHLISAFAPSEVSRFLNTIIVELFGKTASVSVISVTAVSTLWLSSKGVLALYTGLNNVYHSENKNYIQSRLISVVYTLVFIVALILTIVFFGFSNRLEALASGHSAFLTTLVNFFLRSKILIFMIYLTLIFALFYKFLPKRDNRFKSQLPGAAFSAVGWMVFSYIYSIYIENFSNYSYVYGSITAIVFLMLWLYFCMNIFLYGAQINKMCESGFFKN